MNLKNPKKAKVWQLIETPHGIAHYLKIWNRFHFGQASGTPFTIPPLSIEVDWAANSITSELILEGKYTNKEINALTLKLLEHCKKEQDIIELGKTISIQEWKEKIKYGMKGQLLLHQDDTLVTLKLSKVEAQITQSQKEDMIYELDKTP
eukprot:15336934-Ditylum_brightwellii.AAC.1